MTNECVTNGCEQEKDLYVGNENVARDYFRTIVQPFCRYQPKYKKLLDLLLEKVKFEFSDKGKLIDLKKNDLSFLFRDARKEAGVDEPVSETSTKSTAAHQPYQYFVPRKFNR